MQYILMVTNIATLVNLAADAKILYLGFIHGIDGLVSTQINKETCPQNKR